MNSYPGNESANTGELLKRFGGLPFRIEVELGTCELSLRDVLAWKPGAIVATNHAAGVPLRLLAGGAGIADVEVVLQRDALSVRVKNILSGAIGNESGTTAATRPE